MPSQTYLVRAHIRTVYSHPMTFLCGKCGQMTTRQCFPGKRPIYCLECSPRRQRGMYKSTEQEKGMFIPTHYIVTHGGKKTEVCLEQSTQSSWYWVRSALDWFSGESIIRYNKRLGLYNHDQPLEGCSLQAMGEDEVKGHKTDHHVSAEFSQPVEVEEDNEIVEVIYSSSITQRYYSGREICRRFKCGDKLLGKMRSSPEFPQWSQSRDPEGIRWEYHLDQYFPVGIDS